jgi:hypothetical protein
MPKTAMFDEHVTSGYLPYRENAGLIEILVTCQVSAIVYVKGAQYGGSPMFGQLLCLDIVSSRLIQRWSLSDKHWLSLHVVTLITMVRV